MNAVLHAGPRLGAICLIGLLCWGWSSDILYSQLGVGNKRLKGAVTDENGAPLAGIKITAKFAGIYRLNTSTRQVDFVPAAQDVAKEAVSDKNGEWRILGVNNGQWKLTAEGGGLAPAFDIVVLDETIDLRPVKLIMRKDTGQSSIAAPPTPKPSAPGDAVIVDGVEYAAKTKDPDALMQAGESLMETDELDKAAACFQLALKQKPNWSKAHLKLGYAFFNMGKMEQAAEHFLKFLQLEPDSPEAPTVKAIADSLKEL